MIQLPNQNLPNEVALRLSGYQAEVDSGPTYASRVASAKLLFQQRNHRNQVVFRSVREILDHICSGPRRCMYCEDSVADEVEHFRPKDLYPEAVFVWENYLYACGPCNGPKNNKFAVFSAANGTAIEIARPRGAAIVEPELGNPVLIDPRREDPLAFMQLDLQGTFLFRELSAPGTPEHTRAQYTIEVLNLNDREYLRVARELAYEDCYSILESYITAKNTGRSQDNLDRKIKAIRRKAHQTVWAEMKRQRHLLPDIGALFVVAPEALAW